MAVTPTSCLGFLFLGPVLPLLGCVCTLQQQRAACSHAVRQTQQVSRSTRFRLGTDIVYLGVTVVHEASCLARLFRVSVPGSGVFYTKARRPRPSWFGMQIWIGELRLARPARFGGGRDEVVFADCVLPRWEMLKWHAEGGHVSSVGYHVAVRVRCRETRVRTEAVVGMAWLKCLLCTCIPDACMPSRLLLPITTTLSQAVD